MKQIKTDDLVSEAVIIFGGGDKSMAEITRSFKDRLPKGDTVDKFRQRIIWRLRQNRLAESVTEDFSDALAEECLEQNIDVDNVRHFWHKSKKFSLFVKQDIPSYESMKDEIIAEMREYAPVYPKITRTQPTDGHLLVISPADIHIGKLAMAFETGDDYDEHIAVKRVREGIQGCLDKSKSWNIDKILLIIGNDALHCDNPFRTTTAGTKQDTSGMWYSNFLIAKSLYIEIIEKLLTIAPVHIQFNPSNHDWTNGFFLADSVASWFSKCPDLVMDIDLKHRKYFAYGQNLIGSTHGDGAKTADLPLLMAQEAPIDWGKCKHRYIYSHHLHHKQTKDYGSVCVETLRSASGTDGWHSRNGYQFSPKSIECFIHSKDHGQIVRINNIF